jgi:ribose transport system ATP-binding protein
MPTRSSDHNVVPSLHPDTVAGGSATPRFSARGLSKSYLGVCALDNVDMDVVPGSIHGLLGKNGAGKSTFIRILAGAERPDSGTVSIDGVQIALKDPQTSKNAGIYTVFQELSVFSSLSVAENIYVDNLPRNRFGVVNWSKLHSDARKDIDRLGFDIDVRTPVSELRMAHRQIVELAKALRSNAKVILLDEPTATLSKPEVEQLFKTLRQLQSQGISFLYVSHRMDEVYELCDRLTVFRDGHNMGEYPTATVSQNVIMKAMLGRLLDETTGPLIDGQARMRSLGTGNQSGEIALQVEGLCDESILKDVDLTLHRGEVLGVSGLAGNGQVELASALFGATRTTMSRMLVHGKEHQIHSPARAIKLGIGLVPEDRKDQGLVLEMNIIENISLASIPKFTRAGTLRLGAEKRSAQEMQKMLDIKVSSLGQPVGKLSGGNQQKVVFAKWLLNGAKILVLDEPTRGVDVGAKHEIYELIRDFVRTGGSVIFISSELEEVLMCDRVIVMKRGQIAGVVARTEFEHDDETAILELSG